jgi:hypothetical protein
MFRLASADVCEASVLEHSFRPERNRPRRLDDFGAAGCDLFN